MKIVLILLVFFIINNNLQSFEVIKKNKDDYVNKIRNENKREERLNKLFEGIRKKNNKFVKSQFNIKENRDILKKENKVLNEMNELYKIYDEKLLFGLEKKDDLLDINVEDKYGYTPIIVAIVSKNNDILKFLLDNGANVFSEHPGFGKLTLHTAAYFENVEAVKMLLEKNSSIINVKSKHDGWTALQEAVLKNNVEIVKILLDNGANPLLRDNKGGSAMDMAAEFGKGEIVKLLRKKIKENRK